MKFPRSLKPEVFAGSDATRPHLNHVYLDVEAKRMVATDGHRMIVAPVEPEPGDISGFIAAAALDAARRDARSRKNDIGEITVGATTLAVLSGATWQRPLEGKDFPPYQTIMKTVRNRKDARSIGVQAKYLASVFTALGDVGVRIEFAGDLDPILVTSDPIAGPSVEIVIMPWRLNHRPERESKPAPKPKPEPKLRAVPEPESVPEPTIRGRIDSPKRGRVWPRPARPIPAPIPPVAMGDDIPF